MIANITKTKVKGVDSMPKEIIDKISKYRKAIDYVYEVKNDKKNIPYMSAKELTHEMRMAAEKIAKLLSIYGYTNVFIGRFRTAFCVILENKLHNYKIESSYVD